MKVDDVKKIAVYGAGTMGPGLAQVFATAGYDVTMYSRKAETLEKGMSVARANMATFVEHGLLTAEQVKDALGRIKTTQSVAEAATDADMVIESIAEKMDAKKPLYDELDQVCPERTIFTSNTSYLNIYEAHAGTAAPADSHRPLVRPASRHSPGGSGQGRTRPARRPWTSWSSCSARSTALPWSWRSSSRASA